jgi:Domain of unknown function (DUF4359)
MKTVIQSGSSGNSSNGAMGKSAIAIAAISGVMLFTNPNKEAYADYASVKFVVEIKTAICRGPELPNSDWLQKISSIVGGVCKGAFNTAGSLGYNPIKNFVNTGTTRKNLLVFSIYTTEIPGKTFTTIGVFGNFLTF